MRVVLIIVCVVVLLSVAGWITFGGRDGDASLNIESDRIERDAGELMEQGRRAVERVDEKVDVRIND